MALSGLFQQPASPPNTSREAGDTFAVRPFRLSTIRATQRRVAKRRNLATGLTTTSHLTGGVQILIVGPPLNFVLLEYRGRFDLDQKAGVCE